MAHSSAIALVTIRRDLDWVDDLIDHGAMPRIQSARDHVDNVVVYCPERQRLMFDQCHGMCRKGLWLRQVNKGFNALGVCVDC